MNRLLPRLLNNSQNKRKIAGYVYVLLRFAVYGMVGVVAEVTNYTLVKLGRKTPLTSWIFQADWRVDEKLNLNAIWGKQCVWWSLYGQCSLWMFPVYGLCSIVFIERIYRVCKEHNINIVFRGVFYSLAILLFEFISGFILLYTTGLKIWCYKDSLNIMEMTTLNLFPLWFFTGLFVEMIYRELKESRLRTLAGTIAENLVDT